MSCLTRQEYLILTLPVEALGVPVWGLAEALSGDPCHLIWFVSKAGGKLSLSSTYWPIQPYT